MESLANIIPAIASLAWTALFRIIVYKFYAPIKTLIESVKGRKFTTKVAGNELSVEEALSSGVTNIISSSTILISFLPQQASFPVFDHQYFPIQK